MCAPRVSVAASLTPLATVVYKECAFCNHIVIIFLDGDGLWRHVNFMMVEKTA